MTRKFGTAKEWFTFGVALIFPGVAVFTGSYAPIVGEFDVAVRIAGAALASTGILVLLAGVFVWRHNLRQDADAAASVLRESSGSPEPQDDLRGLMARRDELELERAGLKPYVESSMFGSVSMGLLGNQNESIEVRAERSKAQVRDRQIASELRAIDVAIDGLIKQLSAGTGPDL